MWCGSEHHPNAPVMPIGQAVTKQLIWTKYFATHQHQTISMQVQVQEHGCFHTDWCEWCNASNQEQEYARVQADESWQSGRTEMTRQPLAVQDLSAAAGVTATPACLAAF